jgi:hypothetical protein
MPIQKPTVSNAHPRRLGLAVFLHGELPFPDPLPAPPQLDL